MALSNPLYVAILLFIACCTLIAPQRWRLPIVLLASVGFYLSLGANWYVLPWVGLIGYCGGMLLGALPDGRRRTVVFFVSILAALTPLFYFKYAPSVIGPLFPAEPFAAGLALPIGISFFSFSIVGYLIDVYVGTLARVGDPIRFAIFATYFPHLTQGPIARGAKFFPQLDRLGQLDYKMAVTGLRLILLGLFLKIVVADTLAPLVSQVYNDVPGHNGADYILSTVYFVFQVYADFAGYSLIAIGSSKVLGVELLPNFMQPYLATTIPDFWRRWHISMSSWFRSYIFAPIQARFRHWPTLSLIGAMLATFMMVGVWHGAGPNYVLFGFIHGIIAAISTLTLKRRNKAWESFGLPKPVLWVSRLAITFTIVCVTFALFRASSVEEAFAMYAKLATLQFGELTLAVVWPFMLIAAVVLIDTLAYHKFRFEGLPRPARWSIYYFTVAAIAAAMMIHSLGGASYDQQFIYYKF